MFCCRKVQYRCLLAQDSLFGSMRGGSTDVATVLLHMLSPLPGTAGRLHCSDPRSVLTGLHNVGFAARDQAPSCTGSTSIPTVIGRSG